MFDETILIENGAIITMDELASSYNPGYLLIKGNKIIDVNVGSAPEELRRSATQRIDARNMAVMPGMVNSHTHLFQSFIRGLADDKPLLEWLKTAIWPVAKVLNPEEAHLAALVGLIENIRGGSTSVIDHQYIHTDKNNDDAVCLAAESIGVRFLLARGWADMDYHPAFMETRDEIFGEMERLYRLWHGKNDDLIRVEFGPLIPWGCSDDTMLAAYQMSKTMGIGTHIHVAETKTEVEMNLQKRGMRHIEWLDSLGILGPDVQLVHSVWLDDGELKLVQQTGSVIIHCPVSNMYLASGAARINKMKQMGITIALATDGPGSNNNQDMLEVLKTTALLQKVVNLDAMALLPQDVLKMACRGGAAAMGQDKTIGVLEKGKKADVIIVDLDTPFAMPVHHPASALVYNVSGGSVDTVIINGKILMRSKQFLFIDEKAILAQAREKCSLLFERAGVII